MTEKPIKKVKKGALMKLVILTLISTLFFSCTTKKNDQLMSDNLMTSTLEESPLTENSDFELTDSIKEAQIAEENFVEPAPASQDPAPLAVEMMSYVVEKGDTLMLVAFKIYGDYTKWRDLLSSNSGLSDPHKLVVGSTLFYPSVADKFHWEPQGLPHLIRSGETLGTISNDKYGTTSKWKDLWDNNRPLIKDPHKIFAGFTLYYIPEEKRELASSEEPVPTVSEVHEEVLPTPEN